MAKWVLIQNIHGAVFFNIFTLAFDQPGLKRNKRIPEIMMLPLLRGSFLMIVPKVLGVNTFFDNYMLSQ